MSARGWVAGAVLLLGLGGCDVARGGPPRVGAPAPEYAAVTLEGSPIALEELRGSVVLLNVWATWCHPCREEMPDLQRLHERHAARGLQVVGVSIDDRGQHGSIRRFLGEFGVDYPIWLDPDDRVSSTFALIGVPATFLLDRQGTLLWSRMGPVSSEDPALLEALERALAAE